MQAKNTRILFLCLAMVVVTACAYFLLVVIPRKALEKQYELAKQIGQDINRVLQFTPQISVRNEIVLNKQANILELATKSQTFRHEFEWRQIWLGSEKIVRIRGNFVAKAGYDLNQFVAVNIERSEVTVTVPEPKILSVEPTDYHIEGEDGWWNSISDADRSSALKEFAASARKVMERSDLVNSAKASFEDSLNKIFANRLGTVRVVYKLEVSRKPE
ncbi:MAG: DUF4230 domain-containing protein [Terriglobia bacterium]